MRRIVVVATALAVLIAAASAVAASGGINTYTASLKFSPNKTGSGKAPSSMGFTQKYLANGTGGNRTAPLTDIKTTIYGMVSDGKDFPTCSLAKIQAAKSDTGCPKGALSRPARSALLGPVNDTSAAPRSFRATRCCTSGTPDRGRSCTSSSTRARHLCAGGAVPTGFVGPFPARSRPSARTS